MLDFERMFAAICTDVHSPDDALIEDRRTLVGQDPDQVALQFAAVDLVTDRWQ